MKITLPSNPSWELERSPWLWPSVISLSAAAVTIVTLDSVATPLHPLIVLWFLLICPGMAFVRLLRLKEGIVEWTLAIPLSLCIDALVAGFMVYAGTWSPKYGLIGLAVISLAGALLQVALAYGYVKAAVATAMIVIPLFAYGTGTGLPAFAAPNPTSMVIPVTLSPTPTLLPVDCGLQALGDFCVSETPTPTVTVTPTAIPPTAVISCSLSPGWGYYTIQPGDTLFRISARFQTTVGALKEANCLTGNLIYVGQRIFVPIVAPDTDALPAMPTTIIATITSPPPIETLLPSPLPATATPLPVSTLIPTLPPLPTETWIPLPTLPLPTLPLPLPTLPPLP